LPGTFDEPFADPSQIPTLLVSRVARREVTVALSGDGGDEVFGGYNRYLWTQRLWRGVSPVPAPVRRLAARGLLALSPDVWDRAFAAAGRALPRRLRYRLAGEKLHKVARMLRFDSPAEFYRSVFPGWADPGQVLAASAPEGEPGLLERIVGGSTPPALIDRLLLADLVTYLPDNNLAKVDRASMACSLEVRAPFLDVELVEFLGRVPSRLKLRGFTTKYLLKRAMRDVLPQGIATRPKKGFGIPVAAWLKNDLREVLLDELSPARLRHQGIFDAPEVERLVREHLDGRHDHRKPLWTLLVFQLWHRRYVEAVEPVADAAEARFASR
jgi:asparagine synthase (glutamine-hydrolysing)